MEIVSAIVTALSAGAIAGAKDVASDAVKLSYDKAKDYLLNRLQSFPSFAETPSDEKIQAKLEKEIRESNLQDDEELKALVKDLIDAILDNSSQSTADAGIRLENIKAAGNILVENIEASGGGFAASDVTSERDITFSGIKVETSRKN